MTVVPVYVVLFAVIGFVGALFYELLERTSGDTSAALFRRVLYRTCSWACLGAAALLLSSALNLP